MTYQNKIFTHTLTNGSITIQEGALQVYLKNTGGSDATYTGDKQNANQPSTPVSLMAGEYYDFAPNGKGYPAIIIDATTTTVEITAIY